MGQLLIKQGTMFHTILAEKFHCNEERTDEIKKFAESIIHLLGGFSSEISNACRTFFRKLKIDENEDESIIFMSKYIIDILNELSKKITIINKKIELDVIDPLNQFSNNQKLNHVQSLSKSQELLYSVQGNNEMLRELVRNYQINQASLSKSSEQRLLLKQIVESQIEKCNMKWQQIKNQYQSIVSQLNSYNSLRCHFTMKIQIQIVRLINRLVNSPSVQQSLGEYEDMFTENETLALEIKDQMRQRLGKLIIFQDAELTDICSLVSNEVDEREKRIIDQFINLFTNRSNLNEEDKSFEQSRTLILQDIRWTNYFLNKLKNSLYTEIKLNNSKFRELASILKYIFAIVVEADDNQSVLYSLLYISYRVRCKDQYLIKQLGKHDDFWKSTYLWSNIVEYIKLIKLKGKYNSQQQPRRRWKQLFNRNMWNRQNIFSNKKMKSEKAIQDAKIYEILCQVNYYMTKLQLQETFVFDFILSHSQKYNINKESTKKLLQYHYLNKMITTNKHNSNYLMRKSRLEQQAKQLKSHKDKILIAVAKSLKYLPASADLISILLVCKEWNLNLRGKIFKRYLISQDNNLLTSKLRLKIYKEICHPPFSRTVYQRMINQIPEVTQHIDIIHLDTKRSLGWDETLRIKMIEVLKSFSFYHPDHGYLQGMNYLCENILKLTDDSYICYFIFEHLMNNQYYGMYTSNFDGLKLKIYQFMRMLDRERPELAQHLRAQKLQGQHFMLSWAITLWGEMSGQLSWILWDGFLIEGWSWWFKMTLWLMKILEPQLIKMNFQEIMKCFSELHTSLFSLRLDQLGDYGICKQKIKMEIDTIKIEKEVLLEIQKEYRLKSSIINEYLKKSALKKK